MSKKTAEATVVETTTEEVTMSNETTIEEPTMTITDHLTAVFKLLDPEGKYAHFTERCIARIHNDLIYFQVAAPSAYNSAVLRANNAVGRQKRDLQDKARFYYGASHALPALLEALSETHAALGFDAEELRTEEQQKNINANKAYGGRQAAAF